MLVPELLPEPILANLETLSDLDRSLGEKGTAAPGVGLYPRDGVDSIPGIEEQVSTVTIPGQRNNIIWASGMSAVRETVNFAVSFKVDQGTRKEGSPVIAHAVDLYSQSTAFFIAEKKKGVNVVGFRSGDEGSVAASIEDKGADVVFAETVANTPGMPILNLEALLEHVRSLDNPPIVILDNSLPLSTGINFVDLLRPDDPVIVVESGTKILMNNSEALGISYSPNVGLIEALRKQKAHSGAVNSVGALPMISDKLRITVPGFHNRNRAIFNSTGKIALALAEAQVELGSATDFCTTFPTDPTHLNYDYAKQITPDGLDFISPVVFITATNWSESAARDLILRLSEHQAMREQIEAGQIHLGQSFGLPTSRILYDPNTLNIRFAGGFDLADKDALASAIKEAAADK